MSGHGLPSIDVTYAVRAFLTQLSSDYVKGLRARVGMYRRLDPRRSAHGVVPLSVVPRRWSARSVNHWKILQTAGAYVSTVKAGLHIVIDLSAKVRTCAWWIWMD